MQDRVRQTLNAVLGVVQVITNYFASAGFGGNDVGQVSDSFTTAFVPAGLTFAVWGPIYLGLTAYAIYQALPGQESREIHRRVGWLAAGAAFLNAIWTPLFVALQVTISLIVIVSLLATLAAIFVQLRAMRGNLTHADRWAVMIPFSGYFAWITIATVANVTTMLLSWGWTGGGIDAGTWSALLVVVGTLIASGMIFYSRGHAGTFAYTAVLVWAFVGVYLGNGENYPTVGVIALAAAASVVVVTVLRFWHTPERDAQRQALAS